EGDRMAPSFPRQEVCVVDAPPTSRRTTMTLDRRRFLAGSASTLALPALAVRAAADDAKATSRRANRIAVSTYSYWHFRRRDLRDIDTCIDLAADMGFDGVEILHRQMVDESNATLQKYKR